MFRTAWRSAHRDGHPRHRLLQGGGLPGYRLEGVVGRGAGSAVHRARRVDDPTGRVVAVKRLDLPSAPEAAARLRREGELLARLCHPHVVGVVDLVPDRGGVALVMEYAPGGSLAGLLARRGRLSPPEVVAIAAPLADALAFAHERGVVHGDVKPANVLLRSGGEPLLSDFGAGQAAGSREPKGSAVGTPGYVDPAVLEGSAADPRSDVYALGAVCHEMLVGRPPSPDAPWGEDAPCPGALAAVVEKALARHPVERFPDAAAMASALRSALDVPPALPGAAPPAAGVVPGPSTRTFGPRPPESVPVQGAPRSRGGRHHHRAVTAGLAAAAVVVAVLGFAATRTGGGRPTAKTCLQVMSPLSADLDGDGCRSPVTRTGDVLEVEGRRYQLGRPGDAVVLGDWDCDGRHTPALYRPHGEVYFFDTWADEGRPAPASARGVQPPNGRPEVRRGADGCDHLVVR